MAHSKSRTKGSNYELKLAKALSAWWGYSFHRTPNSGAWSSTHEGTDSQAGDITTPPEAMFPFVVEAKNHEGWTMESYFLTHADPISWWSQVVADAERVKKVPMLISHRNRSKSFVSLPYSKEVEEIASDAKIPWGVTELAYKHKVTDDDQLFRIITLELDTMIATFDPEHIKGSHKTIFEDWYKHLDSL